APPAPTATPTTTSTATPTATATATATNTPTATATNTPGPPSTTATNTATNTSTPSATATNTPMPPTPATTTATPTPVPPSTTPPPPVSTSTATARPTTTPGPSATPCALSFTDVHATDYFYTPVLYLACHGVISGYANGDGTVSFRPYNQTTRAQQVKIVVLGFNKPIVTPAAGNNTFADVPLSQPFFAVIETAAADNIVSGYSCGGPNEPCDSQRRPYFRPYANVTRGQLSKIDVVAAGWTLVTPPAGSFADVLPGTAFYPFVETAACHGVISGYACGGVGEPCDSTHRPYFRPANPATRGQIAKIVDLSITAPSSCGGAPPPAARQRLGR
ncbi:MAG TPA: S-layer homology domain-containing protein, partial [Chloroflexia bacterium]|nr:S-layer homology domain-containing protein [Chloroflexia bacterium]